MNEADELARYMHILGAVQAEGLAPATRWLDIDGGLVETDCLDDEAGAVDLPADQPEPAWIDGFDDLPDHLQDDR